MAFALFKQSMLSYMQNQEGIKDFKDFAKKITSEYHQCIQRGTQTTNLVPIQKGNTSMMESLVNIACMTALGKQSGLHTFADDIGKAVIGYWTGATLQLVPPITPALTSIINVSSTSALCSSPGAWTPVGPNPPTDDSGMFLDILVAGMQTHIVTPQFTYSTISLYPGPTGPVSLPGVVLGVGFTIPPAGGAPSKPSAPKQSDSNQVAVTQPSTDAMSQQEVAQFTQGKQDAENIINDTTQPAQAKQSAEEYVSRATEIISTGKHDSTPVYYSEEELKKIDELKPEEFKCESGQRVVKIARGDIGICEYKNRNYGGFGKGEQRNASGRIDQMVNTTGLNNEANVARTGKGYFWCAGATSKWWKEANLPLPTYSSTGGPALCNRWLEWGKENGYFSSTPKEGAAILYRGGRKPGAVHIGIVESIIPGVGVGTIEGNTSGGAAFADNGGGCYRKIAKWSKGNIIGFVNPPDCA